MARTVDEAFDDLLGRLTPSSTETSAAASHRASIEQCFKANFGMTRFFRSGSFGYGTSVSGYSDVDYFAVVPSQNLQANSTTTLNIFADALRKRFPLSNVTIAAPAVVIPFGQTPSEKHEIIPCHQIGQYGTWITYGIPDRWGAWLASNPELSGAIIDHQNSRLSQKAKPIIRLIKAWKYFNAVPIRSFYIEMKVAEYLGTQSHVIYKYDVRSALEYLHGSGLADLPDPAGGQTPVHACYTNELPLAMSWLAYSKGLASAALAEEAGGRVSNAFGHWDKVFNNKFPGQY